MCMYLPTCVIVLCLLLPGEHMTEYELAEYLTTLLGFNEEGGSSELHDFDPSTAGDIIEDNLPQDVTSDMFANELLGFNVYNNSRRLSSHHRTSSTEEQAAG